jgi:hypothetical protein
VSESNTGTLSMTPIQSTVYDSLRAHGYRYATTEADGVVRLVLREREGDAIIHRLALYPDGKTYEVTNQGKFNLVTFR